MRKPRFISWISRALLAYSLASGANLAPQTSPTAPASPVHLTAEQDHQRLMDLLHITALRRGPDGDPKSPNAANVDESKVPTYALPDPLILKNRQRVNTGEMWWKDRRPENRGRLRPGNLWPRSKGHAESELGTHQHCARKQ
jgi:hypothetical protein